MITVHSVRKDMNRAFRRLKRMGLTSVATYTSMVSDASDYNTTTGEVTSTDTPQTFDVYFDEFSRDEFADVIRSTDVKVLLEAQRFTGTVVISDKVEINSVEYAVINFIQHPTDQAIVLHLRH